MSEKSITDQISKYVKYAISSALTVTYLVYIMWGIFTNQAVLPGPFILHFLIFCFCITLVAYLEGLQVAILACEHVDPEKRKESHPRAYKLMTSVRQGNNVERFLVGRQFFTIFVMTLMAQVTSFPDISHIGIPDAVWFIFISTGLPGAMVVTTIGSLQPQLLAAKDPWNFLNLYGSYSTLMLCYALEWTGICTHFARLTKEIIMMKKFVLLAILAVGALAQEDAHADNHDFQIPQLSEGCAAYAQGVRDQLVAAGCLEDHKDSATNCACAVILQGSVSASSQHCSAAEVAALNPDGEDITIPDECASSA